MQPIKIILSIALFTLCTACGSEMDMEMYSEYDSMEFSEDQLAQQQEKKKAKAPFAAVNADTDDDDDDGNVMGRVTCSVTCNDFFGHDHCSGSCSGNGCHTLMNNCRAHKGSFTYTK